MLECGFFFCTLSCVYKNTQNLRWILIFRCMTSASAYIDIFAIDVSSVVIKTGGNGVSGKASIVVVGTSALDVKFRQTRAKRIFVLEKTIKLKGNQGKGKKKYIFGVIARKNVKKAESTRSKVFTNWRSDSEKEREGKNGVRKSEIHLSARLPDNPRIREIHLRSLEKELAKSVCSLIVLGDILYMRQKS